MDDKDPRLTLSGMQLFKGEDLSYEDRVKLQQEQMRLVCLMSKSNNHKDCVLVMVISACNGDNGNMCL